MGADPLVRRVRAMLGQGLGGLVPSGSSSPTTQFLRGDGTWAVPSGGGGGGGTTNHPDLSNLSWTASGHTATARSIPWFASAGAAATLGVGSSDRHVLGMSGLTPTWTSIATIGFSGLYQDAVGRPTSWAGAGLTGTASSLAAFDGSGNPTTVAIGTSSGTVAAGDDTRLVASASIAFVANMMSLGGYL